jgi:5-methylcytosine-specific restriction endonuclease McrA
VSKAWAKGSDSRWRAFRATVLRLDLPERARPQCAIAMQGCTRRATQVHHPVALSKGGDKYDPANAVPACAHCNASLGDGTGWRPEPAPRTVSRW